MLIIYKEQRFVKEPIVIEERTKVVSIAAGLRHTLYLTAGNNVYSCGSNDYGQLGQTKSQCRRGLEIMIMFSHQKAGFKTGY